MKKCHDVEKVAFEEDVLLLLVDGKEYHFPLAGVSPRLLAASQTERARYEISPSGYGIHWPLIDEDLSIDGLLGIPHRPPCSKGKAA